MRTIGHPSSLPELWQISREKIYTDKTRMEIWAEARIRRGKTNDNGACSFNRTGFQSGTSSSTSGRSKGCRTSDSRSRSEDDSRIDSESGCGSKRHWQERTPKPTGQTQGGN